MSGNVWMFSDELDDEDIEFIKHEFVTYNMATDYYELICQNPNRKISSTI